MSAWDSPIITISTGRLNTVNDSVIGNAPSIGSRSRFAGQLGKTLWVSPEQIPSLYDSTVGTLYGGRFRYIRKRAADDDSPAMQAGQIVFWDTTITDWQKNYQVTNDEDLSSVDNAVMIAGIYLGSRPADGNYGFIQDMGMVPVKFRAVLTTAGAIGSRCYAAGTGDLGSDRGTADVLTTDSTSLANARYLGPAVTAPSSQSLTPVLLQLARLLP